MNPTPDSSPFIEQPIPLITVKDSSFQINPQAIEILKAVEGPLIVLGVAGLYRTGKSYLLNRIILNRDSGFGVGSTINACTKGIWMWGKPLKTQTTTGQTANLIVLDSEGLGAIDQDASHDCRIFALVLLLSSVFVYNSVGAIDENAVSNLSLVINLTKHIEVSSKEKGEDGEDSDDFHRYLPSFCWVLRDFSLQLVDEYGREITSQEYLEGALQIHNGITDEVESKNRIRRLIKSFFRDRNCYTLIRPLTEEEELHKLESMSFDQLRTEFVSQALKLRNDLLTQDKIKKMKGKPINGEILAGLMVNYVDTINNGSVPNIENAWTYICRSQNLKLQRNFEAEFMSRMITQIKENIPLAESHIREVYKELKESVLKEFIRSHIGEETEEYIKALKKSFKKIKSNILEENDREFETLLYNEMSDHYNGKIAIKLRDKDYETASDFVKDFGAFNDSFLGRNLNGPLKLERIYKFCFDKLMDGIINFSEINKSIWEEKLHAKEKSLLEFRNSLKQSEEELKRQKAKTAKVVAEKDQIVYDNQLEKKDLTEQLNGAKTALKENKAYFSDQLAKEKEKEQVKYNELEEQYKQLQNKYKELEKSQRDKDSEIETQFALLQNKLSYYEDSENDMKSVRARMTVRQKKVEESYKEKLDKQREEHEDVVSKLQKEISDLKEKHNVFEEEINKKYMLNESMQQDFNKKENEFKSFISQHDDTISKLKSKLQEATQSKTMDSAKEQQYEDKLKEMNNALSNAEQNLKIHANKLKLVNINLEKEKALVKQNKEFYNVKVSELQSELDELKKAKDKTLNSFQTSNVSKAEMMKQIQECKNMYEETIKRVTDEFEADKIELQEKYNELLENDEANVTELRRTKEKLNQHIKELSSELSIVESEKKKLIEKLRSIEESKEKTKTEMENLFSNKIKNLEAELEEAAEAKEREVDVIRADMESRLGRLRALYEEDRANFEGKLTDERSKLEKMIRDQKEEIDQHWKTELAHKEDEVEMLQMDLEELQSRMVSFENEVEDEMQIYISKLEESERILNEKKEEFQNLLSQEKAKLIMFEKNKEKELGELRQVAESFKERLSQKDVELNQTKQQLENDRNAFNRETETNRKTIEELTISVDDLTEKNEELKSIKGQISEQLLETKMKLNRELALGKQKQEFDKKKIAELEGLIEMNENASDSAISRIRQELEGKVKTLKTALSEKEMAFSLRMENQKKALKESETKLNLKIYELQKSNQILTDKVSFTENKKKEIEEQMSSEVESHKNELKTTRDLLNKEKTALMEEVNNFKKENFELGIAVAESNAKYDKDKAVFEGRISFLDQQNKKLKADLNENQHNFDLMFQKLHQFRQADKEEIESSHNSYINSLEQRYVNKIADLKEKHKETLEHQKEKMKTLERQIKKINANKQEMLDQSYSTGIMHEKKVSELLENEKELQAEVLALKAEKDNIALGFQKELEKQKNNIKKKITLLEIKFKKSESDKTQLMFEQEKLRTKWHIEKDHIVSQKNETLDMIERYKKQKQMLQKENEKLRNDMKNLRKSTLSGSITGFSKKKISQFFGNRYKANDSVSIMSVSNNDKESKISK